MGRGRAVFKLDRPTASAWEPQALIPTRIRIECTDDTPLDLSTPTGTLVARMLAAVGDNEVSGMSVRVRAQQEQRRNAGAAPRRDRPVWLADAAGGGPGGDGRGAPGDGVGGGRTELPVHRPPTERRGRPSPGRQKRETSGLWAASTLDKLVRSGRHAGFSTHGGVLSDVEPTWRRPNAKHLVPEDLWRARSRRWTPAATVAPWSCADACWLTGVVKCGRCGETMYRARSAKGRASGAA